MRLARGRQLAAPPPVRRQRSVCSRPPRRFFRLHTSLRSRSRHSADCSNAPLPGSASSLLSLGASAQRKSLAGTSQTCRECSFAAGRPWRQAAPQQRIGTPAPCLPVPASPIFAPVSQCTRTTERGSGTVTSTPVAVLAAGYSASSRRYSVSYTGWQAGAWRRFESRGSIKLLRPQGGRRKRCEMSRVDAASAAQQRSAHGKEAGRRMAWKRAPPSQTRPLHAVAAACAQQRVPGAATLHPRPLPPHPPCPPCTCRPPPADRRGRAGGRSGWTCGHAARV